MVQLYSTVSVHKYFTDVENLAPGWPQERFESKLILTNEAEQYNLHELHHPITAEIFGPPLFPLPNCSMLTTSKGRGKSTFIFIFKVLWSKDEDQSRNSPSWHHSPSWENYHLPVQPKPVQRLGQLSQSWLWRVHCLRGLGYLASPTTWKPASTLLNREPTQGTIQANSHLVWVFSPEPAFVRAQLLLVIFSTFIIW